MGKPYIIIDLLVLLICCMLFSCSSITETADNVESNINEFPKINAYVLNNDLVGTGYWAYNDESFLEPQGGFWLSNNGEIIDSDEVFTLEELEVGKVRTLAPLGYNGMSNINIFFDFDGIIEIETEPAEDGRIRLAHSLDFPCEPWLGKTIQSNSIRASAPFTLNLYPIGKISNATSLSNRFTLLGHEYLINIRAYDYEEKLLVTAQIKLATLEDTTFPSEKFSNWVFAANEVKTRLMSIELVSYEYSDVYKLDESSYEE